MKTPELLRNLAQKLEDKKIKCSEIYCDTIPETAEAIETACNEGYLICLELTFEKPLQKH